MHFFAMRRVEPSQVLERKEREIPFRKSVAD